MKSSSGQAALLLIMVMAVVGAVSVGVASTAVENLRTQEIENTSSQAFRAADAGLELALSTGADVPVTQLGSGNVTYQATYVSAGTDGFISDSVEEGDVVQVSLAGASAGLNGIDVYWNSNTAVKVSLLKGNAATGVYTATYYSGDPDAARRVNNRFSAPLAGGSFQSVTFGNRLNVPINMADNPAPMLVRILVLYSGSSIAVVPSGGTLATGQVVSIRATGTAEDNVTTNLSFSKYSERVPAIFENVLYSNSTLSQ